MYDIALAKGGSEAVVESLYSVMKSQKKSGKQSNKTLINRTKIDWHCPKSPVGIPTFIEEATKLYHTNHRNPFSKINLGAPSKIIQRFINDCGRLTPN